MTPPAGPPGDLLAAAGWECLEAAPGTEPPAGPGDAPRPPDGRWRPAVVPGTAARAVALHDGPGALERDFDARDWWFRGRFTVSGPATPHTLRLGGLATVADVWLNGAHLLHSENMFVPHEVAVTLEEGENELLMRFAALTPTLSRRRPRPRWKCPDLVHQNLRWVRTSLVGRQTGGVAAPAPVGPWREVTLTPTPTTQVRRHRLVARCTGGTSGLVEAEVEVTGAAPGRLVRLSCGGASLTLGAVPADGRLRARGEIEVPDIELWWPHTHGAQPRYEVELDVAGDRHALGTVGFRTVDVDRTDGAFTLLWNGVPLFCRGACWTPPDPVGLAGPADGLRARLEAVRRGNLNMLRVTGVGVYESREFLDLCDELGILLWQDCMLAFFDAPDDPDFAASLDEELRAVFDGLQGRPSLAVVCGGSENEQQAAYLGTPPQAWSAPIARTLIPGRVDELLPGTVYVRSSPGESPLPSMVSSGPGHYFGVGAYLMPLEDARRSGVRFAAECLALATPAEPLDTPEGFAVARGLGHRPDWKATIHRDAHTTWDLEDVRDHYTRSVFGLDPTELRRLDGDRAHLVARATVAHVYESVLSEWRRAGSSCAGALVLQSHDVGLGGGLGLLDGTGRPKSSWYVMRRTMRRDVVLLTDEGVNGLAAHVASDRRDPWQAQLRLDLVVNGSVVGDSATVTVPVTGGGAEVPTATLFGGFRDLSHAHKFGPPAYDAVVATLLDEDGGTLSRAVHLPGATLLPIEPDLGLRARVRRGEEDAGVWRVVLCTRRLAQWVSLDVPGFVPDDSWFHLVPGEPVEVVLRALPGAEGPPRGTVVAVNSRIGYRIEREETS